MSEVPIPSSSDRRTDPSPDGPPEAPWATMITTLALLLFFAILVYGVYYWSAGLNSPSTNVSGEQKLQELQAQQKELTTGYGWDKTTNQWRVPVDVAMDQLIAEANKNGKLGYPIEPKKKEPAPMEPAKK